jgi:hypothetical protein
VNGRRIHVRICGENLGFVRADGGDDRCGRRTGDRPVRDKPQRLPRETMLLRLLLYHAEYLLAIVLHSQDDSETLSVFGHPGATRDA